MMSHTAVESNNSVLSHETALVEVEGRWPGLQGSFPSSDVVFAKAFCHVTGSCCFE